MKHKKNKLLIGISRGKNNFFYLKNVNWKYLFVIPFPPIFFKRVTPIKHFRKKKFNLKFNKFFLHEISYTKLQIWPSPTQCHMTFKICSTFVKFIFYIYICYLSLKKIKVYNIRRPVAFPPFFLFAIVTAGVQMTHFTRVLARSGLSLHFVRL